MSALYRIPPADVQWAADSASMAVIVQQPAARVRIPISLWLT